MFKGLWYIEKMESWGQDYIHMEVKAYIQLDAENNGDFQFGLVTGTFMNQKRFTNKGKRLEMRFIATDELDPANGQVWIEVNNTNTLKGEFIFDGEDSSGFIARRAK